MLIFLVCCIVSDQRLSKFFLGSCGARGYRLSLGSRHAHLLPKLFSTHLTPWILPSFKTRLKLQTGAWVLCFTDCDVSGHSSCKLLGLRWGQCWWQSGWVAVHLSAGWVSPLDCYHCVAPSWLLSPKLSTQPFLIPHCLSILVGELRYYLVGFAIWDLLASKMCPLASPKSFEICAGSGQLGGMQVSCLRGITRVVFQKVLFYISSMRGKSLWETYTAHRILHIYWEEIQFLISNPGPGFLTPAC